MFHTRGPAAAKHRSPKLLFDQSSLHLVTLNLLFLPYSGGRNYRQHLLHLSTERPSIFPAKARQYVFTGVWFVCLCVCDHDN